MELQSSLTEQYHWPKIRTKATSGYYFTLYQGREFRLHFDINKDIVENNKYSVHVTIEYGSKSTVRYLEIDMNSDLARYPHQSEHNFGISDSRYPPIFTEELEVLMCSFIRQSQEEPEFDGL